MDLSLLISIVYEVFIIQNTRHIFSILRKFLLAFNIYRNRDGKGFDVRQLFRFSFFQEFGNFLNDYSRNFRLCHQG
jgi:hypothetical protein